MKMESADSSHFHFGGAAGNTVLPPPFSAYSLLRNYNYLLSSHSTELGAKGIQPAGIPSTLSLQSPPINEDITTLSCLDAEKPILNLLPPKPLISSPLFGYQHHLQMLQNDQINSRSANVIAPCPLTSYSAAFKRQRGEKKPIPDEQKDEKYFERRRRNNHAAKKSRDARKMREDQIAFRATILEHENALLRAQLLTLREEASSLRQMLLQKKALEIAGRESQICRT